MTASAPITVYKLGGSLLPLPDLSPRISRLFASRPERRPLLIVGGGEAADLVRRWDREHQLTAEAAHRLALAAMSLNELLVQQLLPDSRIVADRNEAERAWNDSVTPILCAARFLRDEEAACEIPLPHTWDVTSDSIAAWVAIRWTAAQLILLKSTSNANVESLVDAHFRHLRPMLSNVQCINLRVDSPIAETCADRD